MLHMILQKELLQIKRFKLLQSMRTNETGSYLKKVGSAFEIPRKDTRLQCECVGAGNARDAQPFNCQNCACDAFDVADHQ